MQVFSLNYLAPANKFICIRILDEGPKLGEKSGNVGGVFHFAGMKIKRCKESDIIFFLGFRQDTRTSKNGDASTQLPVGLESADWPVAALRKLALVW